MSWGLPGNAALPESDTTRRVSERLASEFAGNQGEQFSIVLPAVDAGTRHAAAVEAFRGDVEAVDGVASTSVQTAAAGSWVTVVPDVRLRSAAGEAMVEDLRAIDASFDFGVEGAAAELVDSKAAIASPRGDVWIFQDDRRACRERPFTLRW